jgi:tryptophan halogenase
LDKVEGVQTIVNVKFKNFYDGKDEGFHYPFGQPIFETNNDLGSPEEWQVAKCLDPSMSVNDYVNTFYPSSVLINKNKYSDNLFNKLENFNPARDSAVHFDATKFAEWLKKEVCIPNGVVLKNNIVKDIKTNENGIDYLILDDGSKVYSDLFIDCTGFKNILSKAIENINYSGLSN